MKKISYTKKIRNMSPHPFQTKVRFPSKVTMISNEEIIFEEFIFLSESEAILKMKYTILRISIKT